ncbi:MAG: hypothetical protein ACXWTY_02555 [Methylobacter sp.]
MLRIGVGLFGAPAAWLAQFSLSEPLAAHACYPYLEPVSAPVWEGLPVMLVVISLACLAVALLSGFIAWTTWRQFENNLPEDKKSAMAASGNRNWFLIKLSTMSSFIFLVAIIFNICAIFLVSPCSSWF